MFQHLKNIDTAFKHVKLFSVVLIVASVTITCLTILKSFEYSEKVSQRIYLLVDGKAIEAIAGDTKDNIPVEVKDHIKEFHRLFFSMIPDEKANLLNITQALYLADRSAKQQYDALFESGYYAQVVSSNISQRIEVDSIQINTTTHPYYFRFFGKQIIVRQTSNTIRSLITEGYARNLNQRTDNNPHGFILERWTILVNSDLETKSR